MKSGIPSGIPSHPLVIFGIPNLFLEYPMCAQATRLSDLKVKAAKPQEKDYVLSDGDGLQMRVRSNGSKLWNFNYRHPVTKNRINMGLGTFPKFHWRKPASALLRHVSSSPTVSIPKRNGMP